MNKMNSLLSLLTIMMVALLSVSVTSCGGDDNDGGGGGTPNNNNSFVGCWYASYDATQEYTQAAEYFVSNINRTLQTHPEYTRNDFFDSDGRFYTQSNILGSSAQYIHFIDNHTLTLTQKFSDAWAVGSSLTNEMDLVCIINTGTRVGQIGLYARTFYYTYEILDNKLYIPVAGIIFTISGTSLLRDGGDRYTKMSVPKTITVNGNSGDNTGGDDSGGNNSGGSDSGGNSTPTPLCNTLSELKTAINMGKDCSSYATGNHYVNESGSISTNNINAIGRIAYVSTSDVETSKSGSRILVLALYNAGRHSWTSGYLETGNTSQTAMNGLAFCSSHNNMNTYPAAYYAYNYNTSRPSGASRWFLPSYAQWDAMLTVAKAFGTGQVPDGNYWSSTERNKYNAYQYHFPQKGWYSSGKDATYNVRACFAY